MDGNGQIIQLLTEMKESLEREIAEVWSGVKGEIAGVRKEIAEVNKRLDHITGVYERHSNLIAADVLNVRCMEHSVLAHDKAIAELKRRIDDLESRKSSE